MLNHNFQRYVWAIITIGYTVITVPYNLVAQSDEGPGICPRELTIAETGLMAKLANENISNGVGEKVCTCEYIGEFTEGEQSTVTPLFYAWLTEEFRVNCESFNAKYPAGPKEGSFGSSDKSATVQISTTSYFDQDELNLKGKSGLYIVEKRAIERCDRDNTLTAKFCPPCVTAERRMGFSRYDTRGSQYLEAGECVPLKTDQLLLSNPGNR